MFQNREEAGKLLSQKLEFYKDSKKAVILAIPRGGVVVGKQISEILHIPLSVLVVKKLSAPQNPELAIGALAPAGVKYINWELVLRSGTQQEYLDEEIKEKIKQIEEREKKLKVKSLKLKDRDIKIIILVDDGIATGATVFAAIKYIKSLYPKPSTLNPNIILAVPVIAKDTFIKLKSDVDQIEALEVSGSFKAVGQFYKEFPQISDEEVLKIITNKYQ